MPALVGGAAERTAITLLQTAEKSFGAAIEAVVIGKGPLKMGAFSSSAGNAVKEVTSGVEALEGIALIRGLAKESPLFRAGESALTSAREAQGSLGWGQLMNTTQADGIIAKLTTAKTNISSGLGNAAHDARPTIDVGGGLKVPVSIGWPSGTPNPNVSHDVVPVFDAGKDVKVPISIGWPSNGRG